MNDQGATEDGTRFPPGAQILVRDEEWLVRNTTTTDHDGERIEAVGVSEFVLVAADGTTKAVTVMHGGLSDDEQAKVLEAFGLADSPVRLLFTGDVASEGVNLHRQCHHLIHYDIPWSLIRIEQRNGRIDRYGQKHEPRFRALILTSAVPWCWTPWAGRTWRSG